MTLKSVAIIVVAAMVQGAPGHETPAPADQGAVPVAAQGPYPELKGLTKLGVVVEELSAQATACGLSKAPIERRWDPLGGHSK